MMSNFVPAKSFCLPLGGGAAQGGNCLEVIPHE
jgi:hypothetical protein